MAAHSNRPSSVRLLEATKILAKQDGNVDIVIIVFVIVVVSGRFSTLHLPRL